MYRAGELTGYERRKAQAQWCGEPRAPRGHSRDIDARNFVPAATVSHRIGVPRYRAKTTTPSAGR